MKALVATLVLLAAPFANATPGDIGCEAMVDGKKLEVVVYRDGGHAEIVLSRMFVNLNGNPVADLGQPQGGMINVGTEDEPFMNYQISGAANASEAKIRFPEAGDEADDKLYISVKVPTQKIDVTEIEASCQF